MRGNLKEWRVNLGSQLEKVESIMVGGAWQQYPETSGHIVSIARKQREQAVSSVTHFLP